MKIIIKEMKIESHFRSHDFIDKLNEFLDRNTVENNGFDYEVIKEWKIMI